MKIHKLYLENSSGFTLIEVLVYLSLFGIIFGGAVTSALTITQLNERNYTNLMIQEEGHFLLKKISWVLSNTTEINLPEIDSSGNSLSVVVNDNLIQLPLIFKTSLAPNANFEIVTNGGLPSALNNSNTKVTDLFFSRSIILVGDLTIEVVTVSFAINARTSSGQLLSKNFSSKNYVYPL